MKPEESSSNGRNNAGNFVIYKNEPVIRLLFSIKSSPVWIGFLFFVFISLPLTLAGMLTPVNSTNSNYIEFYQNISWSISINIIFPIVAGLTAKYYIEVPKLFQELLTIPSDSCKFDRIRFIEKMDKLFNNPLLPIIIFLITLALNYVYYLQVLNKEAYSNWITNGSLFKEILGTKSGFSHSGVFSALVQVILVYWVLNVIWKSYAFSKGLFIIFSDCELDKHIKPLHEDQCSGLKRIGDVAMICNAILFLLGLYISLKVIDKLLSRNLTTRHYSAA